LLSKNKVENVVFTHIEASFRHAISIVTKIKCSFQCSRIKDIRFFFLNAYFSSCETTFIVGLLRREIPTSTWFCENAVFTHFEASFRHSISIITKMKCSRIKFIRLFCLIHFYLYVKQNLS